MENTILYYGKNEEERIDVKKLKDYLNQPEANRKEIIAFIKNRLFERYIEPFKGYTSKPEEPRMGFATMANMCLLIETLQTFIDGKKNSLACSRRCFSNFWGKYGESKFQLSEENVKEIIKYEKHIYNPYNFFDHVRCGILHQGETTGGWRINNEGSKAIDSTKRQINAALFCEKMNNILENYCKNLEDFVDRKLWENCIKKLRCITENCEYKKQ